MITFIKALGDESLNRTIVGLKFDAISFIKQLGDETFESNYSRIEIKTLVVGHCYY
ncbi:protein of unknown function [Candidatus Nitrosocaldus cavascurensis]|uniref:Uncharacterized protein n=1 Tax=Candidatus Nitrosocaldus cavascurensis TaxID=2058097 RepID=A0A2K5ATF6_9ARCH|nr:protein of unknown function [Candidatus Nitrosocaldus cavascurensis]